MKYKYNGQWKELSVKASDTIPVGAIISWHSLTPPTNWLICDGSYVSKTTYADLYAAIGDTHLDGGTAPAGTFRLPNYKGRTGVGYDEDDTDFNEIGKKVGEKTHRHLSGTGTDSNGIYSRTDETEVITGKRSYKQLTDFTEETTGARYAYTYDGSSIQPSIVEVKIIKVFQSSGVVANVAQTYTESQTDTYSCDYINEYTETETSQDLNKLSQISSKVEILNFYYKRVGKTIMLTSQFHINQALDNEETIALIDVPYISFNYYAVCRSASSGKNCTVTISQNSDNKLRLSSGGSSEVGAYYNLSITYLCV